MKTRYGLWSAAWVEFQETLEARARDPNVRRIGDIGAGANPRLSPDFVAQHDVDYVLLDISESELAKAPAEHTKIVADMEAPSVDAGEPYDFVFTRSTLEHIRSPEAFHRNVLSMLKPGGEAAHSFPTLYALPLTLNRILPERLVHAALMRIQPWRAHEGEFSKFPAFYRWCRGPSKRQRRRFEGIGFEVIEYAGFFGHDYYDRIPPLKSAEHRLAAALVRHPVPLLTSYAYVVLRRPA